MTITINIQPNQEDVLMNSKIVDVLVDGAVFKRFTLDDAYTQKNAAINNVVAARQHRDLMAAVYDQVTIAVTPIEPQE